MGIDFLAYLLQDFWQNETMKHQVVLFILVFVFSFSVQGQSQRDTIVTYPSGGTYYAHPMQQTDTLIVRKQMPRGFRVHDHRISHDPNSKSDVPETVEIGKGFLKLPGNYRGTISKRQVIKSKKQWKALLNKIYKIDPRHLRRFEEDFDFEKFLIIAVFDQPQATTSRQIEIDRMLVYDYKDKISIKVKRTINREPKPIKNISFHFVRIPNLHKTVFFKN